MIPSLWSLVNHSLHDLDVPIIWSHQNAARLPKRYIMVSYSTVASPTHDEYGPVAEETETRTLRSSRRATAELQFFCGQESYPMASRASMLLTNEAALEKACALDVSVGARTMLEHVPALINESQFEDRAILQFDFNYTDEICEGIDVIEGVDLDGAYVTGDPSDPDERERSRVRCREEIRA